MTERIRLTPKPSIPKGADMPLSIAVDVTGEELGEACLLGRDGHVPPLHIEMLLTGDPPKVTGTCRVGVPDLEEGRAWLERIPDRAFPHASEALRAKLEALVAAIEAAR